MEPFDEPALPKLSLHANNKMKPGDIVYRYTQIDGKNVLEPVEVVSIEHDQATIRTSTGETCKELTGMLTSVPYLPDIEQLKAQEDPKDP